MNKTKLKNICVYCGSNKGASPAYGEAAIQLAEELVKRDIGLVYGGGHCGIMGIIADAVMTNGGRVTGIIPQSLVDKELSNHAITELIVSESMHARKAMMAEKSDGFIALPGGIGTLEEIFEIITWAQLGFHSKPCGLLNIHQYYTMLASFLQHTVTEKFVKPAHLQLLMIDDNPSGLLNRMQSHQPSSTEKWFDDSNIENPQ